MPRTFFLIFISGFFAATMTLRADLTDEQKKALFLQTKQPRASATASPSPTPHKKTTHASSSSKKKSSMTKKNSTVHKKHHTTATHSSTTHQTLDSSSNSTTSAEKKSVVSTHDTIIPIDHSSTHHAVTPAAITIEKSGILPDQGLEPTPTPTPEKKHGWGWIFGSGDNAHYQYLSASVRRAIDRAPVRHGRWKYIIVHNSGTRAGNAHSFDIYHRRVRKMVNGLAYHFVIGNGVSSGNGEIEIGHRWTAQLQGGHVASDYLNDISLGICLVGDYNHDVPTKAQLGALNELITYLRHRVGRTEGHEAIIKAHKEINPKPTDCPGDCFPYSWLHGHFG